MGFLDRVLGRAPHGAGEVAAPARAQAVLSGHETLEVVGESHYQDTLWQLAGGFRTERIRCAVTAELGPEPDNPVDRNAVRVLIDGRLVGYLSREDAVVYLPGLRKLMDRHQGAIALLGQIVGGGPRDDGLGMLGVFLDHDPADFGLRATQVMHIGELRTGFSQAVKTDLEDESYDLAWYEHLSGSHTPADVVTLRKLLTTEKDPIDRHFMFAELGKCLYMSRDAFVSALDEFDAVCIQHDGEMEIIRPALYGKFGSVPVIEMYRQATIRCQKAREWSRMRFWAERGLHVYGLDAARPEAVADLQKRLAHAEAKLAPGSERSPVGAELAGGARANPVSAATEVLVCAECGIQFERLRSRGRKPLRCPACQGSPG